MLDTTTPRIQTTNRKPMFSMQWHLTTNCPNVCKHCYVNKRNNSYLQLLECKKIVNDFDNLTKQWDCDGRILFTGGDPFMYPHFFELLAYARKTMPSLTIGIMGNPELLTDEVIQILCQNNVLTYQMSIDGMRRTHDNMRHAGSFETTIAKFHKLKTNGIKTVAMMTVGGHNINEVCDVIDLIVKNSIDTFGFHRLVPMGRGKEMSINFSFTALEFKHLLEQAHLKYQYYKNKSKTIFAGGEPLWKLLYYENGFKPENNRGLIWGGCSIGCSEMDILEDGTVLACRRLPIPIGKIPQQKLRDIFLFSKELNKMREIGKIGKCSSCEILAYCRGCRAIALATHGDFFEPDPHCWK